MEEDAAEVEESQMDITLTFEEWKANERVTWEESKTQSSISEGFFFSPPPRYICHGFHVQCPNDRRLVKREVKSSLPSDICFYTCGITAHVSHKATRQKKSNKGKVKLWSRCVCRVHFSEIMLILIILY